MRLNASFTALGFATGGLLLFQQVPGISIHRIRLLSTEQAEVLSHMSIVYLDDGQGGQAKTIRIEGVNVQVVNGLGATNGYPDDDTTLNPSLTHTNGLGNLIVGYNELGNPNGDDRTGSHNLLVGYQANASSFGGITVGFRNRVTAPYATISGGTQGLASALGASISGGNAGVASGQNASITGGQLNTASGLRTTVTGGRSNYAAGEESVVVGGSANEANGQVSVVSGGYERTAISGHDWVAGSLFEDQ